MTDSSQVQCYKNYFFHIKDVKTSLIEWTWSVDNSPCSGIIGVSPSVLLVRLTNMFTYVFFLKRIFIVRLQSMANTRN